MNILRMRIKYTATYTHILDNLARKMSTRRSLGASPWHHDYTRRTSPSQAELMKELFSACKAGVVERVRRAIAAGVDPKKAIDKDLFSTPLHTACKYVIGVVVVYRPPPLPLSFHASIRCEELLFLIYNIMSDHLARSTNNEDS